MKRVIECLTHPRRCRSLYNDSLSRGSIIVQKGDGLLAIEADRQSETRGHSQTQPIRHAEQLFFIRWTILSSD